MSKKSIPEEFFQNANPENKVIVSSLEQRADNFFDAMISFFRPKTDPIFREILEEVGGGVYKRIDENRELLELLLITAPKVLEECPQIVGWIQSNDEVFMAMEKLSVQLSALNPRFCKRPGFYRAWPEFSSKHVGSR